MKEYTKQAKKIYKSRKWKKVRECYLSSRNYICELCGNPAVIVHHKTPINSTNINDLEILYSFDNLQALCIECHNKIHFSNQQKNYTFDELGNLVLITPR